MTYTMSETVQRQQTSLQVLQRLKQTVATVHCLKTYTHHFDTTQRSTKRKLVCADRYQYLVTRIVRDDVRRTAIN